MISKNEHWNIVYFATSIEILVVLHQVSPQQIYTDLLTPILLSKAL